MTTPSNIYRANKSVVWWVFLYVSLIVSIIFQTIGHVSGGHVNPAVTAGLLAAGKITIARGVLYIIAQCMGAVAGSAILKVNFNVFLCLECDFVEFIFKKICFFQALTPEIVAGNLGLTNIASKMSPLQGFGIEFFLGFVLVLVVFGVRFFNIKVEKLLIN